MQNRAAWGAGLIPQEVTHPAGHVLHLNIGFPASLSARFARLSASVGLLPLLFLSVSVAMLPAPLWFSLALHPWFSGYFLFSLLQAEIRKKRMKNESLEISQQISNWSVVISKSMVRSLSIVPSSFSPVHIFYPHAFSSPWMWTWQRASPGVSTEPFL